MGKKMAHAPVYYVLAQVRFNAILALEKYMPTIQESLRKIGFPDYQQTVLATLNLNFGVPGGEGHAVPALQPQARYQFLNQSRMTGFWLDQTSMTFNTTEYDTFPPFLESFLAGVKVIHDTVEQGISFSERIGIRFLDAVCPKPNETISAYLAPSVLGLTDKLAPRELVHSFSETRTKKEKTTLVSRAVIYEQELKGAAFPPEFGPVPLRLLDRFSEISGLYAVIDTDSWLDDRETFDVANVKMKLESLHEEIRRSFELMVTPHALKVWE